MVVVRVQVHLALAGDGAVTVSWVTPTAAGQPTVWYREAEETDAALDDALAFLTLQRQTPFLWDYEEGGEEDGGAWAWAIANATTASYTCKKTVCPATYASGSLHHATLQRLRPNTSYTYRCGRRRRMTGRTHSPCPHVTLRCNPSNTLDDLSGAAT